MGLPPFNEDGRLPEGRHVCDLNEFERVFVLDSQMLASPTREGIFADLLTAIEILLAIRQRTSGNRSFTGARQTHAAETATAVAARATVASAA